MGRAALTTGVICIFLGLAIASASLTPMFAYYRIIGPIVGVMFVVAGVVFGIYGALKKQTTTTAKV